MCVQYIIVGLCGVTAQIGAGLPFTLIPYIGTRDAHELCDLYYKENEQQYALTLLHRVDTGLSHCHHEIVQHLQGLQDISDTTKRLEAHLSRITEKFAKQSSHTGMYHSHSSNDKTHAEHNNTI